MNPTEKIRTSLPLPADVLLGALDQHVIVSVADAAGNIVFVNQRFCDISGYGVDELIGVNHRIVKSGQHTPDFFNEMWETISTGNVWHGEVCNLNKSGSSYWVKATIAPVLDANGLPTHYISTRTDITDQKQQTALIREMAREQEELLRLAPFGIARLEQRKFVRINEAFSKILGYAKDELIDHSTRDIYTSDEEYEQIGELAYSPLSRGEIATFELELQRKDGQRVWAIAGTCSLNKNNPMSDTLYMIQDITERKDREVKLVAALEMANRADRAKSDFLRMMTHELHTPLNSILGSGQLLEACVHDPDLRPLIVASNVSAQSLLQMVDRALQYASIEQVGDSSRFQQCHLGECITAAVWTAKRAASEKLVSLIDATPPEYGARAVMTDQKLLIQLLGLVTDNAIRFNRKDGFVTVTVSGNADGLAVHISDTGVGMTADQAKSAFEPFVRFCDDGNSSGSGLGLALALRISQRLKLQLKIDSKPNFGTTVSVCGLTLAELAPSALDAANGAASTDML
jgi:PAS domain S-box-containing protein